MPGNSEWNKAVKQAFTNGRRTNKNFSLKQAMFDAKKIYKKGKSSVAVITGNKSRRTKRRGGNVVTPKVGGNAVTPKVGGNAVTPKVGGNAVTPKVGGKILSKSSGGNATGSPTTPASSQQSNSFSQFASNFKF